MTGAEFVDRSPLIINLFVVIYRTDFLCFLRVFSLSILKLKCSLEYIENNNEILTLAVFQNVMKLIFE
jgi:hypothetical protein